MKFIVFSKKIPKFLVIILIVFFSLIAATEAIVPNGHDRTRCGNLNQECCTEGEPCHINRNLVCDFATNTCVTSTSSRTECPTKEAGCYNKDGSLYTSPVSKNNFGFYLPDKKCEKSDNCDCSADSKEDVVPISDGDLHQSACNDCIAKTRWNNDAKCCGDDADDCGRITGSRVCNIKDNTAEFLEASQTNFGDIVYVDCAVLEYLSDGSTWTKCNNDFWKKEIRKDNDVRDYICAGNGKESIIECCGDETCKSRSSGEKQKYRTGQKIKVISQGKIETYYCRKDKRFVINLDTPNSQRTNTQLNQINKETCEKANLKWTGTKCCSEADDFGCMSAESNLMCPEVHAQCLEQNAPSECQLATEYYNDPGDTPGITGGCWNSSPIKSIEYVKNGTNFSVINYNGVFHGCALKATNFETDNNKLLELKDKHTNEPLITDHKYCDIIANQYFCSYTEKWNLTHNKDRTTLSFAPIVSSNLVYISQGKPYVTFFPNDGIVVAERDALTFVLHDAKPNDRLTVNAKKDGISQGTLNLCTVSNGATSCKFTSVPDDGDAGIWVEEIFVNNERKGEIKVTVARSSSSTQQSGMTYKSDGKSYFTFYPNNGVIIPRSGAQWRFGLHNAESGDKLFVKAWRDGDYIGEIPICEVVSGDSCLSTATPTEEHIGDYKEDVYLKRGNEAPQQLGSIRLIVSHARAECCGKSQCWNGYNCIDNQKGKAKAETDSEPYGDSLRCVDGQWIPSRLKYTPDGQIGYCTLNTQCLRNPNADKEQDQCIVSGNYIADNYCEEGNWTSRTKLLALKLLELRNNNDDFTVFCDNRSNTLHNLKYATQQGKSIESIVNNLQSNNFCILDSSNKIVLAASFNQDIESKKTELMSIFGLTGCDRNANTFNDNGQYNKCNNDKKLWVNKKLNSIIYSNTPIEVPGANLERAGTLRRFFIELWLETISSIKNFFEQQHAQASYDETFVKGVKKFDRLYLSQHKLQQQTFTINGYIEKVPEKTNAVNAVIEYKGFDADICKFINQYSQSIQKPQNDPSLISCRKDGKNYYVTVQGTEHVNINPDAVWPDLTSKLRLK